MSTRRTHELKIWSEPFDAVVKGKKQFEYRKEDRGFAVGDVLRLREWEPISRTYSGQEVRRRVTYITRGPRFDVPDGYCVMSIAE